MAETRPSLVIDNYFAAPPEFASRWLTDFQPDDGIRFFGSKEAAKVERVGNTVRREEAMPMGLARTVITLDSPNHWSARGEMLSKRGKLMARTHLEETTEPVASGTHHHVELFVEPQGLGARVMFAMAGGRMARDLHQAFAKMKPELEREYASTRS